MFLKTKVFSESGEWFFSAGEGQRQKKFGPFRTRRGAENAESNYLRKNSSSMDAVDARMESILEVFGSTRCRMAYKLSYVSGCPVQEVARLVELDENEAEKAIQAGEYSLRYYKAGSAARLTKQEVECAIGTIFN